MGDVSKAVQSTQIALEAYLTLLPPTFPTATWPQLRTRFVQHFGPGSIRGAKFPSSELAEAIKAIGIFAPALVAADLAELMGWQLKLLAAVGAKM